MKLLDGLDEDLGLLWIEPDGFEDVLFKTSGILRFTCLQRFDVGNEGFHRCDIGQCGGAGRIKTVGEDFHFWQDFEEEWRALMPQAPDELGFDDLLARHPYLVGLFGEALQIFLGRVLSKKPLHQCLNTCLGLVSRRGLGMQRELAAAEEKSTDERFHGGRTVPIFVTNVEQKVTFLRLNERCLPWGATPVPHILMKQTLTLTLILAAATLCSAADNTPPEGFTPLFNGKDLSGWYGWGTQDPTDLAKMTPEEQAVYKKKSLDGGLVDAKGNDKGDNVNAHWSVQNGELVNDGKGLYLTTDKDYGDFELMVDYKMLPLGDSGIYLRGIPQVQIWDFTEKDEKAVALGKPFGSGGLWNNKNPEGKNPLKLMDKPLGEWNTFLIRMIGERVTVTFNGEVVVKNEVLENFFANRKAGYLAYGKKDAKAKDAPAEKMPNGWFPDPAFAKGPIQLQTHGSEIRWKNVYIREIPAEEANKELEGNWAEDGFKEYVNGKDLSNWQGAVDSYEVVDGAITCKPGKGGDLLTKDEFENGTIRVEFKLPPAGNNGIALRTPLGGHSASDGLELQVIDSDGYNAKQAAAGKKGLEPYQYHGSLYHTAAAKHGYLRPVGEWNVEEIQIDGQKIKVILNGTKILDVDIDKLDRSQIAHPPKGLDHTKGFIGFAGHSDPVVFRSFKVKQK